MDAADIRALAGQWQASRALLAAAELDLFFVLGGETLNAEEIARRAGTDPRATDRLLRVLVTLGLVELAVPGDGLAVLGAFRNTEAARTWLDRASPDCIEGLGHAAFTFRNWNSLDAAVRAGTAVIDTEFETEERRLAFYDHMHRRAARLAPDLVRLVNPAGVRRMLDVGGGSGGYALAFCRAEPGLTAVVLDRPNVVPIARRYIAAAGMQERISTLAGDYRTVAFGEGFDLIFCAAILHINTPDENRALLRRAFAALNPGGRVALTDFVLDDDRLHPAFGAMFALNMLVNTRAGDAYTETEFRAWLTEAGFGEVTCVPDGPETTLMTAAKPRNPQPAR